MERFTVYPAIDLREGRVVRLAQGDPERERSYDDGALAVARRWQEAGARWLHVVNLDGAFGDRRRTNLAALARILMTGLNVQFGGGLRSMEAIRQALDFGVARVVLGTVAVEDPQLLQAALETFGPEQIALGIDARDGRVRIRGWQEAAPVEAAGLARRWAEMGGRWLIFTDVSRDGMQRGVNVAATKALVQETGLQVIASGGVAGLPDVEMVRDAGLAGVIIGRALYEGQVALEAALRLAEMEMGCAG